MQNVLRKMRKEDQEEGKEGQEEEVTRSADQYLTLEGLSWL
jgi:hypothetical protein